MKGKLAFSLILIALLALGTYWAGTPDETKSIDEKAPNLKEKTPGGPGIEITGLVERPYNVSIEDLKGMPSKSLQAVLYCVGAPDKVLKNGTWRGVPLRYLLQKAGIKENAVKVALYASDGYTTDLRVDEVLKEDDIIVAYEYNGETISPRLVVPGRWGYKWIKRLSRIELVDYDFKGTWESAGYPDDAYIENEGLPWR